MALTRKLLKGMGLTEEQVDTIIEAHTDTVTGLKAAADSYKTDAEKLPTIQQELDALKSAPADGYQSKYEQVKKEFDQYKADQTAKETHAAKENAYRALLQSAGVSKKRLAAVLRVSNVDGVELDGNGQIQNADMLTGAIKDQWADFITTTGTVGAQTPAPPVNGTTAQDLGTLSMEEYIAARSKM